MADSITPAEPAPLPPAPPPTVTAAAPAGPPQWHYAQDGPGIPAPRPLSRWRLGLAIAMLTAGEMIFFLPMTVWAAVNEAAWLFALLVIMDTMLPVMMAVLVSDVVGAERFVRSCCPAYAARVDVRRATARAAIPAGGATGAASVA